MRMFRNSMPLALAPILCLAAGNVLAAEQKLTCPVISDTSTDPSREKFASKDLELQFTTNTRKSHVDHLKLNAIEIATGEIVVQDIFSPTHRGGYPVGACREDNNTIRSTDVYSWFSRCAGKSPVQWVYAYFNVYRHTEGLIKIKAIRDDLTYEDREIVTGPCH